jgi:hypothetical protein
MQAVTTTATTPVMAAAPWIGFGRIGPEWEGGGSEVFSLFFRISLKILDRVAEKMIYSRL